jgi:hypothetical protein
MRPRRKSLEGRTAVLERRGFTAAAHQPIRMPFLRRVAPMLGVREKTKSFGKPQELRHFHVERPHNASDPPM